MNTRILRQRWPIALAVIPVMALAACSGSASSESSSSAAGTAATAAATDGASATGGSASADSGPKTIGFVFNTSTDPNQQGIYEAVRSEAEAKGWTVKQVDPNNDAAKANNLMGAYVSQGVDAIVTTVFPPSALRQGIAKANEANIPVLSTFAFGSEPGVAAVFEQGAGALAAERVVQDLGGKGSVLMFTFKPGQPCVEGEKAFDAVFARYPDIQVQKQEVPAPGWEQAGLQTTSAWLKSHPEGSGPLAVLGCWDGPVLGAIKAVEQAGRSDVSLYGQYGEAGAINAVKNGEMAATYYFDQGTAGKQVVDTLGEVFASGASWQPKTIPLEAIEVDSTTIDQFLQDHPAAAGN